MIQTFQLQHQLPSNKGFLRRSLSLNGTFNFIWTLRWSSFRLKRFWWDLYQLCKMLIPLLGWNHGIHLMLIKYIYALTPYPTSNEGISLNVGNPDTTPVGTHGQLYCWLTFVTRIKLEKIKQDRGFPAWMCEQGLFLDLSELRTTRHKQIGIFNKTLPHATPIPLFNTYLRQAITLSHPYQISSQPIFVGGNTGLKTFTFCLVVRS